MWAALHILSLFIPIHSTNRFYKWVDYPWVFKEGPFCRDGTLCPESQNYTWDFYFDKLLDIGGESFVLGDYNIKNSEFVNYSGFEWDMCGFDDLKRRVEDKNGTVLCSVELYDRAFNKTVFLESATGFLKKYPVNGFMISVFKESEPNVMLEVIQSIQELNLTAALYFGSTEWHVAKQCGLAATADLIFVGLEPKYDDQIVTFNTDAFAEEAIKNASLTGAKPENMVLAIPLIARAVHPASDMGYSNMIYDFNADPKGNGSVISSSNNTYYFFSQTRAGDKLGLVTEHGLHGVMLASGYLLTADLYPWDESSLFYALATKSAKPVQS